MLISTFQKHASERRMDIALQGSDIALGYAQLLAEVKNCQQILADFAPNTRLAVALENHPAWVILDLAALQNQTPLVPLPHFFTDTQLLHAMTDAGVSVVITDNPQRFSAILGAHISQQSSITVAKKMLVQFNLTSLSTKLTKQKSEPDLPKNTAKITYTSGTTGTPKGVCLSADAQMQVAESIKTAVNLNAQDNHLCVLPLSTLLENVAGVYAILLAGGTAHILPSQDVGLSGNNLNISQLIKALNNTKANTVIFTPALLSALVLACEAGETAPAHLRFLAVGGAHVGGALLQRASKQNIPVFEGYGLSECSSVVALNTLKNHKMGSAGQPLPHVQIKFSSEQEVLVKGVQFLGYTNSEHTQNDWLATGDIGYLDADGFLQINGRKKNMFITSFGRNVSPEWPENLLCSQPAILQACLFGEAKPFNIAVIVAKPNATQASIHAALQAVNAQLPDYARMTEYVLADALFSPNNGQLTPNGRLKRDAIWAQYQKKINALYKETA